MDFLPVPLWLVKLPTQHMGMTVENGRLEIEALLAHAQGAEVLGRAGNHVGRAVGSHVEEDTGHRAGHLDVSLGTDRGDWGRFDI